jgi:hypothetical protein
MNRYNIYSSLNRTTAWGKKGYIHILGHTSHEKNIIKDIPIQMVFKPTDTISHLTKEWDNTRNELEKSGVHKLT